MLLDNIDIFIFDFDGVLTNNMVHINQDGKEWVSCSRADGLAFDVLRKLKKSIYILSKEKNHVVTARAKKLKVLALQGVDNKVKEVKNLVKKNDSNLKNVMYIGNDINDYNAMNICGYTACPSDSHKEIKSIATIVLNSRGGYGVVRELLEDVFKLDFIKILFSKNGAI